MNFDFVVSSPVIQEIMKEQVRECSKNVNVYSMVAEREYNQTKKYLPTKPGVVLDLGSGLGRAALALHQHYNNEDILYILADRMGDGGHGSLSTPDDGRTYRSSLFQTSEFVLDNGLLNFSHVDIDHITSIPKFDLVVSRCAVGMHVPIMKYLPQLHAHSNPGVTMIFGVGNWCHYEAGGFHTDFHDYVKKRFRSFEYDAYPYEPGFPSQSWVVLKGKK